MAMATNDEKVNFFGLLTNVKIRIISFINENKLINFSVRWL